MNGQRQGSVYRRCTLCGHSLTGTARDGRDRAEVHRASGCGGTRHTWAYRVDVSAPGAPRKQRRGGGFATKAEALEAMAEVQRGYRKGTAVEPSKQTLGQYLDGWLEVVKATKAPATYQTRRHHVAYIKAAGIGDVPMQALSELDAERMAARLAESGRVRGDGGISPRSIADICTTLTTALNAAVRQRMIPRNVAQGAYHAPTTSADSEGIFAWTADELRAWLEVAAMDELWPFWRFCAFTGVRPGEARAVRDRDLDLTAGTVTINRAAGVDLDGEPAYRTPKSARGRRTIDLDAETVEVLRDARKARTVVALGTESLAFTLSDGSPITKSSQRQRFEATVKRAGVPRLSPHGLRHTHASLLLLAGVPLHVVSRRLGHSSEAFTAKTYAHVLNGQGAEAASRLADLVAKDAQ